MPFLLQHFSKQGLSKTGVLEILSEFKALKLFRKAHLEMERLTNRMMSSRCESNEIVILHFEEYLQDVPSIKDLRLHHSISCLVLISRKAVEHNVFTPLQLPTMPLPAISVHPKNCLCSVRPTTYPLPASLLCIFMPIFPILPIHTFLNSNVKGIKTRLYHHFGGG